MTPAASIIARATAAGIVLEARGDKLRFDAPHGLPPDLRSDLVEHKAEILALLDDAPPPIVFDGVIVDVPDRARMRAAVEAIQSPRGDAWEGQGNEHCNTIFVSDPAPEIKGTDSTFDSLMRSTEIEDNNIIFVSVPDPFDLEAALIAGGFAPVDPDDPAAPAFIADDTLSFTPADCRAAIAANAYLDARPARRKRGKP